MTKRSLASLCIKIMAIYVILSFMHSLPRSLHIVFMAVETSNSLISISMMISAVIGIVFWLGIGLLLIRFADAIARKLVHDDEDAAVISVSNEDLLYRVFIACLGLVVTILALPLLSQVAYVIFMANRIGYYSEEYLYRDLLPDVIFIATKFGIGIFLMTRPETVLGWIKKLQPRANTEDASDHNPDDISENQTQESQS